VKDEDKRGIVFIAKKLQDMGFALMSTRGTAKVLRSHGVNVEEVGRYDQGKGDMLNLMTFIKNNEIALIVNTPSGESSQYDMRTIRATAILHNVPCITTLQGARQAVNGIEAAKTKEFSVQSLQCLYNSERDFSCAAS